jgi:oligopeptide transport system permease protein
MDRTIRKRAFSLQIDPSLFEPATSEEKGELIKLRKGTSYWKDAWRRLSRNPAAMIALGFIILIMVFSFIGPIVVKNTWGYTYEMQTRGDEGQDPNAAHWLGTDDLGRDILVRIMSGAQISLLVGIVATVIIVIIGSTYGAVSGYAGGKTDNVMQRFVEILYAVPDILIVILLSIVLATPLQQLFGESEAFSSLSVIGPGILSIFITFALLYWVGMARIVRGQVMQLKEQEFVTAARALGASRSRIIFKHLIPNCIGPIIVTATFSIPNAIFVESFLSFIGLGVSAPMASLGSLASDALGAIVTHPLRLLWPALMIALIILAFNQLGDGLRDALDPRMRK